MGGAAIRIEGLRKRFGATEVLRGLDLDVLPGELFTLLGPSGCGKTTLLRVLAGFERPDAGQVTVDGSSILPLPAHRRGMGVVFQSHAVFPHLSVFENVAFGLRERGVPEPDLGRRVEQALARVRLLGLGGRSPHQLSGGQQQRVGLARALAIEPRVLLLDEPLSSLDARLRVELREEIRELQRSLGLTAVYVTHDQEEALAISDRVAVLERGLVQQTGAPAELYARPASRGVASFVGRMSFLSPALAAVLAPEAPGEATVGVRPEDLLLGEAGQPGRVVRRSCLGSLDTFLVEVEAEPGSPERVLVERQRQSAEGRLGEGESIRLAVRAGGWHAFDAASGARLA